MEFKIDLTFEALKDKDEANKHLSLVSLASTWEGPLPAGPALQSLVFPAPVQGRYVCLESLSNEKGDSFATLYRETCTVWPRGAVPADFYAVPTAPAATLLLSGGIDPVTPARHGERVAKALGARARHVVVANAGHGVMALGCMRDVLYRFVDAVSDDEALAVDATCATGIPRPPAFALPGATP